MNLSLTRERVHLWSSLKLTRASPECSSRQAESALKCAESSRQK